jgi:glycosyltransferase involved in cell wall biosynthesis
VTSLPRVAVTTGALRVPPTYFVLQHAALLGKQYAFEVFARVADIRDDSLGIPIHDATPVGGAFGRRSRASLLFGGAQARAILRFDPALVHQHFGTWSEPAIAAAQRAQAPLVTTVHGYDIFATLDAHSSTPLPMGWRASYGRRTRARSTTAAFAASDRILAVSEFLAGRAIAAGAASSKVVVHYQGIDTDFFAPVSEPVAADPPVVLFIGALSARKGPADLLEASRALHARHPHRLVFIGEGDQESLLRERAAEVAHVSFPGRLDRGAVREQIRQARMLVLPTQEDAGWREAAGLVLLEAQASGTPVVAYASGGTPEMVRDGATGLLVSHRDIPALADAIRELLELPSAEYRRMSVEAREFVVRERSLAVSARELDAHYRELIG